MADEKPSGAGSILDASRTCVRLFGRQRRRLARLVVLGVLASGFESVGALLLLLVFRAVSDQQSGLSLPLVGDLQKDVFPGSSRTSVLVGFCAFVGAFFVVRSCVLVVQTHLQYRAAYESAARLSRDLIASYLHADYAVFLERNSAALSRTAFDAVNIVANLGFVPLLIAASETFIVVGLLTVVAIEAPLLTLLSLVITGTALWMTFRVVHPRLQRLGAQHEKLASALFVHMQQGLGGARDVRLNQSETYFTERLGDERMEMARGLHRIATLSNLPRLLLETIFAVFILLFVAGAALESSLDASTVALLGLFAYVALRVMPSINRVSLAANNLRSAASAIATVADDLEANEAAATAAAGAADRVHLAERITVEDVGYSYPNHDAVVLRGVSLEIRRGQSVGLVGATGAGKSTLVDLIVGLLHPSSGRVLVDGNDIAGAGVISSWQRSLGVVSQTVFLLDDTLRRNIAFGLYDPEIDDLQVARAVQMAQLDQFVASLPKGLETVVGERGVRLSGGQRQRVAIARALYREPEVVVFDEGTSALDTLTEREVIAAVDSLRGDQTLVMVAHRLSTVRNCDVIVLLEDGAISATGTYDELIDRSDSFRRMAL